MQFVIVFVDVKCVQFFISWRAASAADVADWSDVVAASDYNKECTHASRYNSSTAAQYQTSRATQPDPM